MNRHYDDILDRIPEPPAWFDEHAVPRWGAFAPNRAANIYADEAVLMEIHCQGCGVPFLVCLTSDRMTAREGHTLAEAVAARELHYGDPPNIACCAAGPTMNSEPKRVVEFWRRDRTALVGWVRKPDLETDIEPDWCKDKDNRHV